MEAPAKNTGKKSAKKTAVEKVSPVDEVLAKYTAGGWETMRGGNSVDIIARRGKRYQFVQVVPADKSDEPAWTGEARNVFVQNALSNNAEPIQALISISKARDGSTKTAIKFTNCNLGTTVKIGGGPKAKTAAAKKE